jgi:RNA polymerase sigma-70 factor, ECF subfamily
MTPPCPDTEELLDRAAEGDDTARHQLLMRHQQRLRQMVAFRLDRRLHARLDPSDILQEAFIEVHAKLSEYLRTRPLPFYPWLRQIAWQHLVKLHRRHMQAGKRSVLREDANALALSDESALVLAERLATRESSPSNRLLRDELRRRVHGGLAKLSETDRELLVLRYLEHMPLKEIACVMGTTEGAVKTRHVRALQRLHSWLSNEEEDNEK